MTAASVLMWILEAAGVRYLFGNPGTTELSFLDALADSRIEYVLALQEATAVAAADGYAQASRRVAVVNLHVMPGLANGLSILDNAHRARTPLVVTAGQQDTRLLLDEPILSGDMARVAEPFTKWSCEVRRPEDAPVALRRALKVAQTPPTGPVFLSLPMDVMGAEVDDAGEPPVSVTVPASPDPQAIALAADLLLAARAPLIVAGDGVARAGAMAELVAVAERLGARVHGEPIYRRASFPGDHALWRGGLFPTPDSVRKALEASDAVLIIGARAFSWFLHADDDPCPPGLTVIQVDDDPWEVGKTIPTTLGIVGHPRAALADLARLLDARATDAQRAAARGRLDAATAARAEFAKRLGDAARREAEHAPISPAYLMHTLAGLLPRDAIVVDESASSLPHVLRHVPFESPDSFFGSKTGTLGWAMGAALGVQLACPDRKVVATVGDGSLMYAPQALWTAARYRLPVTYVVPNNASYAILKSGMLALGLPAAKRGVFPGMDLVDPEVDYVRLATALGVRAERVEAPSGLRDTLAACLAHPGPSLVDVAIERGVHPMR